MIITSTPYRISFFGGGTDYPVWFREHGGAILATSINRYCYLSCRFYPPFFDHKHRIVWSEIETPNEVDEIKHPVVRAAIGYVGFQEGLEIHHNGDLPARSGLGSSSSFAVGLLHAFYAMKGQMVSKAQLAKDAIHLEQVLLKENVGIQDQILAAHGGLNKISIDTSGGFRVDPLPISQQRREDLESHLMLFYTGISRFSSDVAAQQIKAIPTKSDTLQEMGNMVSEAADILINGSDIKDFGRLLHESWLLKRSITESISTPLIDELYQKARAAGAIGGKLLGAGGGGFVLLMVPPESRQAVLDALDGFLVVPFQMENEGSRVIVYQPEHYSNQAFTDRKFIH